VLIWQDRSPRRPIRMMTTRTSPRLRRKSWPWLHRVAAGLDQQGAAASTSAVPTRGGPANVHASLSREGLGLNNPPSWGTFLQKARSDRRSSARQNVRSDRPIVGNACPDVHVPECTFLSERPAHDKRTARDDGVRRPRGSLGDPLGTVRSQEQDSGNSISSPNA